MDDLISRQDAIDALDTIGHVSTMPDGDKCIRVSAVNYVLMNLPPAQPQRPKGKWMPFETDLNDIHCRFVRCSVCGKTRPVKVFSNEGFEFNFCPNCGADMRGDAEC